MSDEEEEKVGYKRPPSAHRWKKGQCGNPTRKRKQKEFSPAEIIETVLARKIRVKMAGTCKRMSIFEAIVSQLSTKADSGDIRAIKMQLRYSAFDPRPAREQKIIVRSIIQADSARYPGEEEVIEIYSRRDR